MKKLTDIFSKDDCVKLIEYCHGENNIGEVEGVLHTYDMDKLDDLDETRKAVFLTENGAIESKLEVTFCEGHMKIVIASNGEISYQNFSGCRFPLKEPLKAYEFILKKMKEE
jgi:hypothetical protein